MKLHIFCYCVLSVVFLSACGGGSSSGGGPNSLIINDGVYEGSQTLIISTLDGELVDQATFEFSASVFESNLTIFDSSFSVQANIVNNTFRAVTDEFEQSDDEVSCLITIIYEGSVNDGAMQGSLDGQYRCRLISGEAEEVELPISGSFEGVRGVMSSKISLVTGIDLSLDGVTRALIDVQ